MKETWEQSIWLAKKINETGAKIDAVFAALTNIQLVVNGTGEELAGTNVTVTDGTNTFQGTFSETLKLTFQLEALGTYTITYVQNVDDEGNITYGTTEVVISDYGYFSINVAYFPGYDVWEYWCELAGVDSSDYSSLESLLQDSTAVTMLMNVDEAVDYMIASTEVIMPAIMNESTAVQALVRSSYALSLVKKDMTWRTAIANSATAKTAIYNCSDVIKTASVSAPSKSIKDQNNGHGGISNYTSGTYTFEEENVLAIYMYCYGYSNKSTTITIASSVNGVQIISNTGWGTSGKWNPLSTQDECYVTLADEVTEIGVTVGANNYSGTTTFNGYATLYYI